LVNFIDIKKK